MAEARIDLARAKARERREMLERLKGVLIDQLMLSFEPDEIADDTGLFGAGLGLDSVDALEVIFCVENEFGIRTDNDDMLAFRTLNTVIDLVEERSEA